MICRHTSVSSATHVRARLPRAGIAGERRTFVLEDSQLSCAFRSVASQMLVRAARAEPSIQFRCLRSWGRSGELCHPATLTESKRSWIQLHRNVVPEFVASVPSWQSLLLAASQLQRLPKSQLQIRLWSLQAVFQIGRICLSVLPTISGSLRMLVSPSARIWTGGKRTKSYNRDGH